MNKIFIVINLLICSFILRKHTILTWKVFHHYHHFAHYPYKYHHNKYENNKIQQVTYSLNMKYNSYDNKAKSINKVIIDTFSDYQRINDSMIQRFKCYLDLNKKYLNQINIITLMHRCTKNKLNFFHIIDGNIIFNLLDITNSDSNRSTATLVSLQGISNAIYSLQQYSDTSYTEQKLIRLLSKHLLECKGTFDSQSLSNIFYGVKNFTWNSKESAIMLLSLQYAIIKNTLLIQTSTTTSIDNDAYHSRTRDDIDNSRYDKKSVDNVQHLIVNDLQKDSNGNEEIAVNDNDILIKYLKLIQNIIERLSTVSEKSSSIVTTSHPNIPFELNNNNHSNIDNTKTTAIEVNHIDIIANQCASAIQMTPQGLGSSFLGIQGLGLVLQKHQHLRDSIINDHIMNKTIVNALNTSMIQTDNNNDDDEVVVYVKNAIRFLYLFLSNILTRHQGNSLPLDAQALANILLDIVLEKLVQRIDYDGIPIVFQHMTVKELSLCLWGLQSQSHIIKDHPSSSIPRRNEMTRVEGAHKKSILMNRAMIQRINKGIDYLNQQKIPLLQNNYRKINKNMDNSSRRLYFQHGDEIGLSFSGLRKMNASDEQIRLLLHNLYQMFPNTSTTNINTAASMNGSMGTMEAITSSSNYSETVIKIDDNQVSSALYGLKSMSSTYEVRNIVRALSDLIKIQPKELHFSGKSMANALYGLQSMNIGSPNKEIESIIMNLLHRFDPNAKDYTGQHIAMMCYGLKSITITNCNQSSILKLQQLKLQYQYQQVSFNDFGDVISMLLYEISEAILITSHPIAIGNIATAIYGLQGISSNLPGLRALMETFTMKIKNILEQQKLLEQRGEYLSIPMTNITGQEIAMIAYGMQNMGSNWYQIQDFIDVFGSLIEKSTCTMTGSELSQALYGLKSMGGGKYLSKSKTNSMKEEEYLGYLYLNVYINNKKRLRIPHALMRLLFAYESKFQSRSSLLSTSMVASALYGLHGISSDLLIIRRILFMLTSDLSQSTDIIDCKGIGNALFGLQNMTSKSIQVKQLLNTLAIKIKLSNAIVNAQSVSNSLYGLQGMSSNNKETREILKALTEKIYQMPLNINNSEYIFTGQNIGNSLWGLRNMSIYNEKIYNITYIYENFQLKNKSIPYRLLKIYEEQIVVSNLINILTIKINESNAELNGQNLGNAFYSLYSMSSDSIVVRQLLGILAKKLVLCNKPLSGLDVVMILHGLKNMDSNLPEVRVILGALLHKIRGLTSELHLRELSMAIIGILQVTPWVRDDYLNVLSSKIPQIKYLNQPNIYAQDTYNNHNEDINEDNSEKENFID